MGPCLGGAIRGQGGLRWGGRRTLTGCRRVDPPTLLRSYGVAGGACGGG